MLHASIPDPSRRVARVSVSVTRNAQLSDARERDDGYFPWIALMSVFGAREEDGTLPLPEAKTISNILVKIHLDATASSVARLSDDKDHGAEQDAHLVNVELGDGSQAAEAEAKASGRWRRFAPHRNFIL